MPPQHRCGRCAADDFETLQRDPLPVAALFDFHYGKAGATNRFIWSTIPCARSENEITLPVVAGIFGGGDSNTFMQGIRRHLESSSLPTDQVVCFTLVIRAVSANPA